LVGGAPCGSVGYEGCCDEEDNNWWCHNGIELKTENCSGGGGAGGSHDGVLCATDTCESGEICCVSVMSTEPSQCIADASACSPGIPVWCDGPEDCPNTQVCCGDWTGTSYAAVECVDMCTGIQLCDPSGPPDQCGPYDSCEESSYLDGYYICK